MRDRLTEHRKKCYGQELLEVKPQVIVFIARLFRHTNPAQATELAVINSIFGNDTPRANPSPTATYVLECSSIKICTDKGF